MAANSVKKIAILTSGGDSSGMNAVIRAVTRYAISRSVKVIGFYEGFKGLIANDHIALDSASVGGIIDRGGTMLFSARSEEFKTEEGMAKAVSNLKKNEVDGIFI
jgi:6-phosphofructokinase 1